jgi:hypothetical protein
VAAARTNYIVVFKGHSQVYGCATKAGALETPPPDGCILKDKAVFFVAFEPDTDRLVGYRVPQEEVLQAEIKERKRKKDVDDNDE